MSDTQAADAAAAAPLVDFSNPMVVAQIEAAAFRLASQRSVAAMQTIPAVAVERTSVAEYRPSPDEVTVVFTRFTLTNNTSYMRGQTAGFPSVRARALIASGHAQAVHTHEVPLRAHLEDAPAAAASRRARS